MRETVLPDNSAYFDPGAMSSVPDVLFPGISGNGPPCAY